MSRISGRFQQLKSENRTALIPFVTAGDPAPGVTVPLMHAMVEAGASIIELGVPFSDPMADGPVIQKANERALIHKVSLRDVLAMVKEFRSQDQETPVILMGYLNPIEVVGYQVFAEAAAEAGVDGLITVDIPPEEAEEFCRILGKHDIDPVFLVAPTSTPERIKRICDAAGGFVYSVSFKGITGAAKLDVDAVATKLEEIRQHTDLPVGVGFGIKDPATAQAVGRVADAVIVGSALVNRVEAFADQPDAIAPAVAELLAAMRSAMDEN
ncbi:MAG: tryptophan synthase subunit alpha [Chromatiales bacterium]|nr:tryptophan synthase subunit alpha [Chromatiales bacterium]